MILLAIVPGKCKCGLVLADSAKREVCKALVIESKFLIQYVREAQNEYSELSVIIGNGTTSDGYIKQFGFLTKELFIVDESNSTLLARERYFEIFPARGIKRILPKGIIVSNLNLDAISALVILEKYSEFKYNFCKEVDPKTWRK